MAWFTKPGVISNEGTKIHVYLLDGTLFKVLVNRQTTAGAICVAIRDKLGLEHDNEYGLYRFDTRDDEHGGRFSHIKDKELIITPVKGWDQADIEGSARRRLYFKRQVYVIESVVDTREDSPLGEDDPHHKLAVAEANYNFLECNYRFPLPNAIEMAALLLHSSRGAYDEARDTLDTVAGLVEDVVPRYLLVDRTDANHTRPEDVIAEAEAGAQSHESVMQCVAAGATCGSRWANSVVYRRVGCVDAESTPEEGGAESAAAGMALSRERAAELLKDDYAALATKSRFEAQTSFVQKVKEFVAFGSDIYVGKRTWRANDVDATEDEVMERTEDVTVCVAYSGIVFTGLTHPLGCEEHKFDSITKWTLSEDNRVFAFQVEEPEPNGDGLFKFVVYIVTEQAPDVMQSVDRFVTALVDHSQDKLAPARAKSAITDVPADVDMVAPPTPDCVAGAGWGEAAAAAESASSAAAAASSASAAEGVASGASSPEAAAVGDASDAEAPTSPGGASEASASDALPANWEARYDDDGDVYYYNTETELTQWERPTADSTPASPSAAAADDEDLPANWEARYDDDGDVYYYNTETELTQWERPTA